MTARLSVVIPNRNGGAVIGTCLQALYSSRHAPDEVVVVDDCSIDNSPDVIRRFPCIFVQLEQHVGASKARNTGARRCSGDALFFIDADCVIREDTLEQAAKAYESNSTDVIGGTYTPVAFDDSFFSTFQSIFVHYAELKHCEPDYVASHAMVIGRELFLKSGGFPEDFMPMIEDVEFSHRLRASGTRLRMDDGILVSHIFNYDFAKSFRNAFRKSKYWTAYSLMNRNLLADSGTASIELKVTVAAACVLWALLVCYLVSGSSCFLACLLMIFVIDLIISRGLIKAFFSYKDSFFGIMATLYYTLVYPVAVAAGGAAGVRQYYHLRSRTS